MRKPIGQVISAEWSEERKRLEFLIEFKGTGQRLSGALKPGFDTESKTWISPAMLKKKGREMLYMKVYDDSGSISKGPVTKERLSQFRLKVSLTGAGISVIDKAPPPDTNSFLNRILR